MCTISDLKTYNNRVSDNCISLIITDVQWDTIDAQRRCQNRANYNSLMMT